MFRRIFLCMILAVATSVSFLVVLLAPSTNAGPMPIGNGDVNGDGSINIGDPVYLLSFLFSGGPPPVAIAGGNPCICEDGEFRIVDPLGGPARLFFGPTDDCSLGIDPALPGLIESDPTGFRLLGPGGQGCRLIFGPTMDCTVEVDPGGPPGLLLRDPSGIRVLDPFGIRDRLIFGPTDDCSIFTDPALPGLVGSDPVGFRLMGGQRLIFGPTDDCTVGVDPTGLAGLTLRDPCIRILNPFPGQRNKIVFGDVDDCAIFTDPTLPGLVGSDPVGFRLLGVGGEGRRLIFGPTMDCTIGINPGGPPGLTLSDPVIRIANPIAGGFNTLVFGPTDECRIQTGDPAQGMLFTDPAGFMFQGGPVFATEFIPLSAGKHKENVRPIEGALAKLIALEGVQFEWKDLLGGKSDIGFIAEKVAQVVPEVVAHDDTGEARGVSYDHLVALTVEGIKEQQRLIHDLTDQKSSLESKVSELESQNAKLADRLSRLEALIQQR